MKKLKELFLKNENKIVITLLIIIISLGVITRIYIGSKKEYLQIDEGYSYGLMNYEQIDLTKKTIYITIGTLKNIIKIILVSIVKKH